MLSKLTIAIYGPNGKPKNTVSNQYVIQAGDYELKEMERHVVKTLHILLQIHNSQKSATDARNGR
jgi:hypothetical protein